VLRGQHQCFAIDRLGENMKKLPISLAVVLLAALAGCASVPMASADADHTAKQFVANPSKANLYIYRNESMGAAIKMDVFVDEKAYGQTAAKTYLHIALNPGKHKIRGTGETSSDLELDAKAGQNYFVWQEVKMGALSARNKLQLVDEKTGKKGVSECKLTASGQ
jgi:hypothetical protein